MVPFNFQLAIIWYFLFLAWNQILWFLSSKVSFVLYNNLQVELKMSPLSCDLLFQGLSDMASLACACHPVCYLCTSTSLLAVPLVPKNYLWNNYGQGLKYFLLVQQTILRWVSVSYRVVPFSTQYILCCILNKHNTMNLMFDNNF